MGLSPEQDIFTQADQQTRKAALGRTSYFRAPMFNSSHANQADETRTAGRFLLWIDEVGGYLVCQGDEITLGQPETSHRVDIPILGDLSKRHVKFQRDAEGYAIAVRQPVKLDGRTVSDNTSLPEECELTIGRGVRFQFSRPHPFSRSARLMPLSRHRTQPTTDGVLLMAESLVLGPQETSHIVCPRWPFDLVLFRQGEELWCRGAGELVIDGKPCDGEGRLTLDSHVSGDYFSLSLEAV